MIERLASRFETSRLVVRLVKEADLDDLLVVHADADVTRYLPYDTWRSRAAGETWFARIRLLHDDGRSRQFVIVDRSDGRERVIGAVVLFNPDASNLRAEIGYVLGIADRGRGLMREAVGALADRAFDDLGLRRIEAFVDPRNAASGRLLVALGFRHEGRLRARGVIREEIVDSDAYGLLRTERRR